MCSWLNVDKYLQIVLASIGVPFPGKALVDAGESFKQLADIKYSLEDSVRQNFLEPLHNLQTKDLKEVNVSQKSFLISGVWSVICAFFQNLSVLLIVLSPTYNHILLDSSDTTTSKVINAW